MCIQNMIVELEPMRMFACRASKIGELGLKADRTVTATELSCGDSVFRIADKAPQIPGDNGFSEESSIGRHFRDARVVSIDEGTQQMMDSLLSKIAISEWRRENGGV